MSKAPAGSIAHIYWPQVNVLSVLQLAGRLYGAHLLSASDSHTIDCTVTRGVTYVPIPPGTGGSLASLFTVDLPLTVTTGQEFNIVVRRVASRRVPSFELAPAAQPQVASGGRGRSGRRNSPPRPWPRARRSGTGDTSSGPSR